ncbi:hypothetical protein JD508_18655 [Aeromonas jandaei]|uniref:hypothetical protein n=1 Tax=Aeromonas jandaei TaxID=650 RepID=UPI00191FEA07|nr:hypothetical protein [Aeromonas jandaei]MBL0612251.1 hypothetical protein [Aeromonas jandaei]
MSDEKDIERQYRKNLMLVASIVFIYSIAGGQISSELSLFGAKLTFHRPEWLEYAMVVIMCFFWWRHCQVSVKVREEHLKKVYKNMRLHKWVFRRLMRDGNKSAQVKYDSDGWARIYGVPKCLDDDGARVELYWLRRVFFGGYLAFMDFANQSDDHPWHEREIKISLAMRFSLFISYLRSLIVVSYKDPEFGDGVFPTLLFIVSSIAWVQNYFQIQPIAYLFGTSL